MPPHTTLHYTMPPNTTNSKSTATAASSGTTQMNTSSKSSSTPKTPQQRRPSSSSYVFAPSWYLNNKSGPSTTVLNSAYVSTTEEKSVKEEVKGVGASKKDGFSSIRQTKEGLMKDGSPSLNRSANGVIQTRSKSRDLSGSRSSEAESYESPIKHGRSRSVSQVNQSISSSSSSFDKNFPTLAKKKQLNLSVDLPAKNVENIWANLDTKSKLLSPTSTTPGAEEHVKFNIPNIDNEPELERRMSLVPKVEIGKLDGKRSKHSVKRKISRSLSVDSVARGTNGSSGFGFGVGIGIPNGRSLGQTQNARSYIRENAAKPISAQPQRPRAASISASNGIKKASVTASRMGMFGQSITGRKSSIGSNSKYLWSNATMGKMGSFKIFPEEEEEEDDDDELLNDRKEDVNPMSDCDHIEEEEEEEYEENNNEVPINKDDKNESVIDGQNIYHTDNPPSLSSSLEREEKFLLQLGWQKPYNNNDSEWAITEEEKRFFVKLVRALNGISVSKNEINASDELSYSEINLAKKKWAALVKNIISINGVDKIFNGYYQPNGKRVTFNDETTIN